MCNYLLKFNKNVITSYLAKTLIFPDRFSAQLIFPPRVRIKDLDKLNLVKLVDGV